MVRWKTTAALPNYTFSATLPKLPLRLLFPLLILAAIPARAEDLSLGLPFDFAFGADCWIQHYPAHGGGAQGYTDYPFLDAR